MKVVITGVAGFLGSNLARALLALEHQVVGVDNLSQGTVLNLEAILEHPAFSLCEIDILDRPSVLQAAAGCDAIVHLAAYKIPRYTDALDTLRTNGFGSESVIEAAVANKAKIVAASTSDVYGKNPELPFSERSDLVVGNPSVRRWAYAISKMFEEQLLFAYHERHGIDFVLLRFFGGYGPGQHLSWWGGPQSVFIDCALDNRALEIHGDGQQTRSFTYVSDHIDGIVRALLDQRANNRVINLGNTEEITIEALGRLIWRLVRGPDEPARLTLIPYETFGKYEDVRRRVPDISLARELLGFTPRVDLETGLKKTIQWQVARRQRLFGAEAGAVAGNTRT